MRLFVLYLGCLAAVCSADLHKMVRYFDTLDLDNMQVVTRKKRTADGTILSSKHISFKTLGRKFNMVLFPGSSVIGPDFRARTVDMDGRVETFVVNPNNFYTGFLEDDKTVEIDADLEDGILTASIYFSNETYAIEPAWRHRLTSTNATMIAYRRSDVIWDEIFPIDPKTGKRTRMKDGIRLPVVNSTIPEEANKSENGSSRHKRSVVKNICPLLTVADYYFFREIGNNKRRTSAAYIISAMQRVNRYFNRTVWDPDAEYKNMRFHISEMIIHTHFTTSPSYHYNAERNWDYTERLGVSTKSE